MSKYMSETERLASLYCTPPHITKALLKRELFGGSIWEPCAGRGHIVTVLRECGYRDVMASDLNDWGFPCYVEDFLASRRQADCILTNPPFHLKKQFLSQAKRLARHKIAMLLPYDFDCTMGFLTNHAPDTEFALKAVYGLPQAIRWHNVAATWGKLKVAWFVFERGYSGDVVRSFIKFSRRNRRATTRD